jgi:hypothetical protein
MGSWATPTRVTTASLGVICATLVLCMFIAAVAAWALFLTLHAAKKVGDAAKSVAAVSTAVHGLLHGVRQVTATAAATTAAAAAARPVADDLAAVMTLAPLAQRGSAGPPP